MGAYKLGSMFSLGGSLIYNRHSMDLEYKTYSDSVTENSAFNEYSANVIAMWSF